MRLAGWASINSFTVDGPGALFRPVDGRDGLQTYSHQLESPWAEISEDDTEEPGLVWLIQLELLPALWPLSPSLAASIRIVYCSQVSECRLGNEPCSFTSSWPLFAPTLHVLSSSSKVLSVSLVISQTISVAYVTGFGKTLRMGFFSENWVWCMVDKLYHRVRPIVHFIVKIQHFVCDPTTPSVIEKLRSKALLCTRKAFPHTTREPEIN